MRLEAAIGESFKLAKQVGNKEQADGRAQGSLERRATEDAVRCPPPHPHPPVDSALPGWVTLAPALRVAMKDTRSTGASSYPGR